MGNPQIISSTEAAEVLHVSRELVGLLVRQGRLSGRKIGRTWVLNAEEVRRLAELRRGGRQEVGVK